MIIVEVVVVTVVWCMVLRGVLFGVVDSIVQIGEELYQERVAAMGGGAILQ